MGQSANPSFGRSQSANGTFGSVCNACLVIVGQALTLAEIEEAERNHVCSLEDLRKRERLNPGWKN